MLVAQEYTLPCGLKLPNRLCKAAMAEQLAPSQNPTPYFLAAYAAWAEGSWGMVLTGNVMVSETYLGSPGDVANTSIKVPAVQESWAKWASTCQASGTPTIVQLCHPGRQSPPGAGKRGFWDKTIAPSAVPLKFGEGLAERAVAKLLFGTPRAMTGEEVEEVVDQFVRAARQCFDVGFKGVQLHGAHGYLLAQFLSPKTNLRTDTYGGSAASRAALVLRILASIRAATSPSFCIGIKLNSADVSASSSSPSSASLPSSLDATATADTMAQIQLLIDAGIDFIEISGGSYEDPKMGIEPPATSTAARESFFLDFATRVRERFPDVALMVTGGFRTRAGMEMAIQSGGCDLIGIGRPAAVLPRLPKEIILNEEVGDADADVRLRRLVLPWWVSWIPLRQVGVGYGSAYYQMQIQRFARGEETVDNRVALGA